MQVACLAFVAAVKRFDPDRGQSLRAFVIPSILGSLRRHFRDATWSVHVTRRLQERGRVAQEALRVLGNHNGRTPDVDEVAAEIGVTREEALEALAVHSAYRAGSLDTLTDEWRDLVSFEEARYENVAERIALSRALAMLSPRDRAIVTLRFGLDMTQSEIGARMGISQMHVSRILRRSLEQMSHVLADTDSAT